MTCIDSDGKAHKCKMHFGKCSALKENLCSWQAADSLVMSFYLKLGNFEFWVNYLAQLLVCGSRVQLCFLDLPTCSSALTDSKKNRRTDRLQALARTACSETVQTPPCREPPCPSAETDSESRQIWKKMEIRRRDALPWRNKQTSWHITRNATSKHKQTQPEDCFFYFLLLQTDKSKQSVSRTDVQTERTDSLCYSHNFVFLFISTLRL